MLAAVASGTALVYGFVHAAFLHSLRPTNLSRIIVGIKLVFIPARSYFKVA
jgi:hypothetical protein